MNIKVSILTEGGINIGLGHITRCKAIYQAFQERGVSPAFFINADDTVTDVVKDLNYEIVDWFQKRKEVLSKVKDFDIVIVDSYLADIQFYEEVSNLVKVPVYIDDNKRLHYPRGIIVNGSIYAEKLSYPKDNDKIYLLGIKYAPLRKEFWNVPTKKIKENIESVMITFGGNDMRNMTPKVLKILNQEYPNLTKYVIIGKAFKNISEIEAVSNKNTHLVFYPSANEMIEIMLKADIAISAGGQTLYELARVGVPTIAVAVAENQFLNIKGWQKAGFIKYVILWQKSDICSNIKNFIKFISDYRIRKESFLIGRRIIDGTGSLRIAKEIIKNFINKELHFRSAEIKDIWDIYEISNDKTVRYFSINSNTINKNDHEKWFLENYKKNFYVMEFKKSVIGQVRFSSKKNKIYVNISLHKDYRGLGLGKLLLFKGIEKFLRENPNVKEIFAIINKENMKSIKIFEKLGFKKIKTDKEWLEYKFEI